MKSEYCVREPKRIQHHNNNRGMEKSKVRTTIRTDCTEELRDQDRQRSSVHHHYGVKSQYTGHSRSRNHQIRTERVDRKERSVRGVGLRQSDDCSKSKDKRGQNSKLRYCVGQHNPQQNEFEKIRKSSSSEAHTSRSKERDQEYERKGGSKNEKKVGNDPMSKAPRERPGRVRDRSDLS